MSLIVEGKPVLYCYSVKSWGPHVALWDWWIGPSVAELHSAVDSMSD